MTFQATVTSKNQITLPVELVRSQSIKPGDKLIFSVDHEANQITIKKMEDLLDDLAGSLKVPAHLRRVPVDEAIEIAKQRRFSKK